MEVRLDAEIVPAVLGSRYRRDLLDREAHVLVRNAGKRQLSLLADLHPCDVTLLNLQNDSVGVQRRDLEEYLAEFDWRPEQLL